MRPNYKFGRTMGAKDILLKIEKDSGKLRLSLNGQNILDWFRQKYQEVKQATNYYKRPNIKSEVGKKQRN